MPADRRGFQMALDSEDEVKKALGIDSWRNLSKEKMLAFVAAMPEMANDVRLKLIEQLPAFQKFALDAVGLVERAHASTLQANSQSQSGVHEAFEEVRALIKGELDREELSEEHSRFLIGAAMDTAKMESEKDTENKQFHDGLLKTVGAVAGVAVLTAVVLVGGKIMISRGGSPS